jgi:divalent metal cation (Fe/Co/Zn/Cd) transporter
MSTEGTKDAAASRAALVRRGLWLTYATIGYNSLEAVVGIVAGWSAGSVALVGFGVDSVIEVAASVAAFRRLRADHDHVKRATVEARTLRVIGVSFIALALYVAVDAIATLRAREEPHRSVVGIALLALSAMVMPVLSRAKRRIAAKLESRALRAESAQTSLCAYLSLIALVGLGLNAALGWWWADPVAALLMTPIILREGIEGVQTAGTYRSRRALSNRS